VLGALVMLLVFSTTSVSCSSAPKDGTPVKSLCIFDEKFENCWVNKPEGRGFTIEQLREQQAACYRKEGPCWFGLDSLDLQRVHSKLNQGR
jgi:hypothetical protein